MTTWEKLHHKCYDEYRGVNNQLFPFWCIPTDISLNLFGTEVE